jgi:hypothetical protein
MASNIRNLKNKLCIDCIFWQSSETDDEDYCSFHDTPITLCEQACEDFTPKHGKEQ